MRRFGCVLALLGLVVGRSRLRRRTNIHRGPSRSSCRMRRAALPISPRASSASRCAKASASNSWSRTSRAHSASSPSRRWPARGPTATRCSSATSRPMRSRRSCSRRSSRSTSSASVVSVSRLAIYPSFLLTTTANFDAKSVQEWSLCQEESRQGALHQRRRRQLSAFRYGDLRQARRYRDVPYSQQDRRRRHDQRSRGRRRAGRVPQCRELGLDDQGRQAAADRGAGEKRLADYPDVPTLAEAGFPGVGTLHWQSMLAPAETPKEALATLFKAIVHAAKAPQLQEPSSQTARQRQAQRVIGGGAVLAQERARRLAQDGRRGEDRFDRLARA